MTASRRNAPSPRNSADCRQCAMEARCWPEMEFDDEPLPAVRESAVRSGDFLWRPGDSFGGPVIVHSGCVMVYRVSPAGEEAVLQFALPGDLIGLEALATGRHELHARALGEVLCCRIPCSSAGSASDPPGLNRRLLWRASDIILRGQVRPRHEDPTGSVLGFLRDIGQRLGREAEGGGQRSLQVRLPMSRLDIGHYLGFAEETVCRAIRRLEEQGLIEARGRHVSLLAPAQRAS